MNFSLNRYVVTGRISGGGMRAAGGLGGGSLSQYIYWDLFSM